MINTKSAYKQSTSKETLCQERIYIARSWNMTNKTLSVLDALLSLLPVYWISNKD